MRERLECSGDCGLFTVERDTRCTSRGPPLCWYVGPVQQRHKSTSVVVMITRQNTRQAVLNSQLTIFRGGHDGRADLKDTERREAHVSCSFLSLHSPQRPAVLYASYTHTSNTQQDSSKALVCARACVCVCVYVRKRQADRWCFRNIQETGR